MLEDVVSDEDSFPGSQTAASHPVLTRDLWCLFLFAEDIGSMGLGPHPYDLI